MSPPLTIRLHPRLRVTPSCTQIAATSASLPTLPLSVMLALLLATGPTTVTGAEPEAPAPWSDSLSLEALIGEHADSFQGPLNAEELGEFAALGGRLFEHKFTAADGGTRPLATQAILPTKRKRPPRAEFSRTAGLDANACASCHNVPVVGGSGDFSANVFVSEGFRQADFDTTDPQFSNERNTNHLFGAGLIELLAREMSRDLQAQRTKVLRLAQQTSSMATVALSSKDIEFGQLTAYPDGRLDTREIDGIDADLVIRPFSQKGVMTSLRQFTVNALNHHHGIQAPERFSSRWTDETDFDGDGIEQEISRTGVSALVAWQATLPPPVQALPTTGMDGLALEPETGTAWLAAARRGEQHFEAFGCAN